MMVFMGPPSYGAQENLLRLSSGRAVFASGMNLAWIDFARDLADLKPKEFTRALDEISAAGGNTVRWWLHLNGATSPRFDDGQVAGLNPRETANLKAALDLARARGLVLVLCLWSFDMLKADLGVDVTRNRRLIEDPNATHAYLDKALIPLVRSVRGHPAILAWEICNEPEGMTRQWGWTTQRTSMHHIQRFHNLIAGAIHRTAPGALVTTGCWNIQVMCDKGNFTNYYMDEALIQAGGDPDGTLDFYQVHYYPRWYGEDYSPFHHPASYWELDKPILIGEVQASGFSHLTEQDRLKTPMSTEALYRYALENGYAGCLTWTWTGHDGMGDLKNAADGMQTLKAKYPDKIIIPLQK